MIEDEFKKGSGRWIPEAQDLEAIRDRLSGMPIRNHLTIPIEDQNDQETAILRTGFEEDPDLPVVTLTGQEIIRQGKRLNVWSYRGEVILDTSETPPRIDRMIKTATASERIRNARQILAGSLDLFDRADQPPSEKTLRSIDRILREAQEAIEK